MAHATRTRIAALVTVLTLGGLSAIGLGLRSQGAAQTTGGAPSAVPVSAPAVVQVPTKVATQVSPTGGGEYEDDDEAQTKPRSNHEIAD